MNSTERHRQRLERRLMPEARQILALQGREIAAALEDRGEASALRIAGDPMYAFELMVMIWGAVAPPFASATYEALRPAKDFGDTDWLQFVIHFLETKGHVSVYATTDYTQKLVREAMQAGVDAGLDARSIARKLREEWPAISRMRAERIVRTEVVSASNWGTYQGADAIAREFGIEMEKEWNATSDGRTREDHADMHGETVAMDGQFIVGGEPADYPGDPSLSAAQRIQCRCAIAFIPVTRKSWRAERNDRIKRDYPVLRDQWGQVQALEELAARENISARQVKRIMWED